MSDKSKHVSSSKSLPITRPVNRKVNILIVADRTHRACDYDLALAALGENLLHVHSHDEALAALLRHDVAVVLLDLALPDLDGFALADDIRQQPHLQATSVVFVCSGQLSDTDIPKACEHGAVDCIVPPVVPELLRARVKVFAELHRKSRQLEALNRSMRELSRRIITMQDEERRRIARELHDGLGQELTAAKMTADAVRKLSPTPELSTRSEELADLIHRAITQVRSLSHLLHPPLLDETGLVSTIQWYLDGLTKRSGIHTTFEVHPAEFPRLPAELETALYRVIQEALTNVFRHSGARHVWVVLAQKDDRLIASVRDDGKGISGEIATLHPGATGVGIASMRQRLAELSGDLRLENRNPGTLVEVMVPMPPADARAASAGGW